MIDANICKQGCSQQFAKGDKRGDWETEVPQRGPGAEPRWRSGAEPQKPETYAPMSPLATLSANVKFLRNTE